MGLELILSELRPFKPSHFGSFFFLFRVSSLCNQLLLQFSMNVSQTSCTYCGHFENMRELDLILTKLRPFKRSHFNSFFAL